MRADPDSNLDIDVAQMQQIRRAVADLILKLEATMSGDTAPGTDSP